MRYKFVQLIASARGYASVRPYVSSLSESYVAGAVRRGYRSTLLMRAASVYPAQDRRNGDNDGCRQAVRCRIASTKHENLPLSQFSRSSIPCSGDDSLGCQRHRTAQQRNGSPVDRVAGARISQKSVRTSWNDRRLRVDSDASCRGVLSSSVIRK